ncbi:hypothetical protein pb186bvf_016043 [Paramecium bursaria]
MISQLQYKNLYDMKNRYKEDLYFQEPNFFAFMMQSVPLKGLYPPKCVHGCKDVVNWRHDICQTQAYINRLGDVSCQEGCNPYFIQHAEFECESVVYEKFEAENNLFLVLAQALQAAELSLQDDELVNFNGLDDHDYEYDYDYCYSHMAIIHFKHFLLIEYFLYLPYELFNLQDHREKQIEIETVNPSLFSLQMNHILFQIIYFSGSSINQNNILIYSNFSINLNNQNQFHILQIKNL